MTKITILPKKNPDYIKSSLRKKTMVTFNVKNFRTAILMALFIFSFPKLFSQTVFVNPASPFVVPADVVGLKVECWGGGGAGGGSQNTFLTTRFGGGGGGGGYSVSTLTVSPGQNYTISVGAGGTPASNANGGNGGTTTVTGLGGSVSAGGGGGGIKSTAATGGAAGIGNTRNGGTGGTGTSSTGGGGGGGAGNAANGSNGNTSAAAAGGAGSPNVAPYRGGNGGAPNILFSNNAGSAPGGGGSGGLSFSGTSSGAAGATGQVVITLIYPAPIITGFAVNSACAGGNITINGSNLNNATSVTVGGTAVASITSNTTTQIVAKLGSGTTGTVSVTTLGGTGTSAQTFSVTPLPAAPSTTSGSKCGIGSITLSAIPAPGATTCNWYSAASAGTLLASGTTSANLNIAVSGNTTYYVSSLTSNGCESATRTAVTATAKPEVVSTAVTSVAAGCAPLNATLTANPVSVAKNTVAATIPDNDIFNGDVPVTTSALVSGLSGNLDNNNIKINYVKINISHTYISDIQVRLVAPDGAVLNLSNQHGGSGDNYTNTIFQTGGTPVTSGTAPFGGTYAPDDPFSNFNGKNPNGMWGLNVIDKQWVTFVATGTINNWEIGFTDNNGLTYSWTSTPSGFASTSRITPVSPTASTLYNITALNGQNCSGTGAVSVSINPPAEPIASGGGSVCEGNDINLSSDNIANGQLAGNTYTWTGPNSFSSNQQNPTINAGASMHTGDYFVTVTNQFLCTATAVVSVVVNANPVLETVSQKNVGCTGGSDGELNVGTTVGTAPFDFTTDFITFNNTGIFTNLSAGPVTVYVSDANGCTAQISSTLTTISTTPPTQSVNVPFTGMPSNVCDGTVATLSISPVTKATFYTWDAPPGSYFNGNPANVSPYQTSAPNVQVTFGPANASLYSMGVQAGNGCGSTLRKIQKVRGIISVPASISGQLTACENMGNVIYTTPVVQASQSYQWTITGDATVSGTGVQSTVNFGPAWTSGTLCVAAQTSCYTTPAKCINISKSATGLGAISGVFTACPNSSLTYTVPASPGAASYTWSLPPSATGASSTNSINVNYPSNYSAVGSVCVTVTSICGVTAPVKCKTVAPGVPQQPSSVSGSLAGVCNQSINYQCPSSAGTTYNWTVPAGASIISGQGSNAVNIQFASLATGPVCVTASNTCGNSTARCIAVKGAPSSPSSITVTPSSWCANTQGIEFVANTTSLTGSYSLSWIYPSSPVASYVLGGGNSNSLILDWGTGNGNVIVNAFNSCGSGSKVFSASTSCRDGINGNTSAGFNVYPNPSAGMVNIDITANKGTSEVYLVDIAGRKVFTEVMETVDGLNHFNADLKSLAKGAYVLNVTNGDTIQQVKIVLN